jgi:hypothetical protein
MPWHPPPPPNSDLRLKPRMLMPDSPRPAHISSWSPGSQLPVSYRVAIAIDAVVLVITILSLVLLGVYIRRQYRRRKASLLHDTEYNFDSDSEDDAEGELKLEEAGIPQGAKGEMGAEKKKKGHVRWTSSVVGMGVFARLSVDEGRVKLEGKEGERAWGYDPRDARTGGPYEVTGDERQTKVNLRVAAGYDGFRGN